MRRAVALALAVAAGHGASAPPPAPPPARPPPADRCSPIVAPIDPSAPLAPSLAADGDALIARIGVLGPNGEHGMEAIVRSIEGGWCTLVPAGPPITFAVDRGWVWFARTAGGSTRLARVHVETGTREDLAALRRQPSELALVGDIVLADRDLVGTIDALVHRDHAPASAVPLPAPADAGRPPEVGWSARVARIAVPGSGEEMIVRTTRTGACVLVPPGPPLEMAEAHGWVWFVRAEPGRARYALSRIGARGGPIERIASVPFLPDGFGFRDDDLSIHAPSGRRWSVSIGDDSPTGPAACHD